MTQNILDIQHLSVVFNTPEGRTSAIRDLSLTIRQGEILAVVGESGCGKSILCRTIMGLLPKQAEVPSGSIRLSGRGEGLELAGISEREYCRIRGADISMVFQDPMTSLDPSCSVGDQIAEAIRLHAEDTARKNDPRAVRTKAVELMDAVGIDRAAQRYDSMPWMLSGGMRQRCVLAMALAREPQMLIADEPTTALDVTVQAEILDLLLHLRDSRNLSILFISHDLGVVSRVADRIAIMYAGRIIEEGTTAEVLQEPAHPYTRGLLRALPAFAQGGRLQPIPGAPPTIPEGFKADAFAERNRYALGIDYVEAPPFFEITPTHRAATWMLDPRAPKIDEAADAGSGSAANAAPDGRSGDGSNDVACDGSSHAAAGSSEDPPANRSGSSGPAAAPAPDPPALLEVRGLSHSFRLGRRSRVDAVKDVSFTIRQGEFFALVGESGSGKTTLARCILGMIRPAAGTVLYDGADITDRKQSQRRIAREIQFISQDPGAALDPRMTVRDLIAEPLQLHRICSNRRERNERIVAMLREVQLDERILDRYPAQLSGGQKQRVSIARAFVMDPKLLVADEPLASLDVSIQAQIVELLLTLQKQHSTSVLFISHDLSMVELISDRVGVMCRGSLVETAPTEELFRAPKHPYTQKLLAAIPAIEPARRETNPK